jgi:hypothetical protein
MVPVTLTLAIGGVLALGAIVLLIMIEDLI